ncbi:MAG: SpoIIE family protein phosphatase [Deltaproteobacteria bacterium]|nr:SpoIIE family protein phosphatase [Deltaproteobacteria bacterium]
MKTLDYSKPIQISRYAFWIGTYDPTDNFQCNSYLLVVNGKGTIIDPGSVLYFDSLLAKLSLLIKLDKISHVIVQHQDPDVCGNMVMLMDAIVSSGNTSCKVYTHSRNYALIRHYGGEFEFGYTDKIPEHRLILQTDAYLEFIHTPYLHAPGAAATYFNKDKILFSSDIFGGMTDKWQLFAEEDYFKQIASFHKEYMPSKEILLFAMTQFERYDIETIAPQHGSIIKKEGVKIAIENFKDFECGLYIDQKFRDELRVAQKKIEEQNEIMNAELSMAAHFQQGLLPDENLINQDPRVDIAVFYKPFSQVSGDFLIIDNIDTKHLGIMLVDVVDHGVTAGLATIQIKTLFDEYKNTSLSAAAILRTINDKAFSIKRNDIFFTALYATYDFEKSSIIIASAAGVPPVHFSARNKASRLVSLVGTPLGTCRGDECLIQETSFTVETGDVLIFQTDGLIDCRNTNGEPFESVKSQRKIMKEIKEGKGSGEILDAIIQKANLHMGEHEGFEDDVTMAVFKRKA